MAIKLPQNNKQILVTNGKNSYQGVISYTKNIDFDEEGVIKLSAPMCKIFSSEDDADLSLPIDIFSYDDGDYKFITENQSFNFLLSSGSVSQDTNLTFATDKTRVITWVGGLWHIGGDDVYSYTGATSTTVYANVIATALNYIELFTNRNTLVGNNSANVLKQYSTAYANTTDLTIPANFTITGTAYSNNFMGVITRQTKNQGNAYFFTWDGSTTAANNGYPVNDSYITSLKAYKSSWVMFTSAGQLLYFNGGGFEVLGTLPVFNYEDDLIDLGVNNSITIGNNMDVLGDIVYINYASLPEFSSTDKPYRPHYSGGVYCYDQKVGLYHKHAPSYSEYAEESGTASSNIITFSFSHYLKTGDEIWLDSDDQGLTGDTLYYAIVLSTTTIKLASSYDNAIANTSLTITDGTINLWFVKRTDYGIESLRLLDVGFCKKDRSYNGAENSGILPFFMGCAIRPNTIASSRVKVINAIVPKMSNRGYFVTGKFQTDSIEEAWQSVVVKHQKLSSQSSIVVKAKTKDQDALIIGDMSSYDDAYTGRYVTWDANGMYFETTEDLSSVEVGDEVHIYDGAGAGQTAHITTIATTGSVYQITLDEVIRGITSNAKSLVSIDKWRKIGTITPTDDAGQLLSVPDSSSTLELKVELRGVAVKINEIQVISSPQIPA